MKKLNFELQVKLELIKQKKTLTDLANEMGVSVAYVSDIVKGNRKAEHYRNKICKILKIKNKRG